MFPGLTHIICFGEEGILVAAWPSFSLEVRDMGYTEDI